MATKRGAVRVGIGGWTFDAWRETFYPVGLPKKKELAYAAARLGSIEINATYYSIFKPETWRKWHDETPDDFVFAVKASRFSTHRKVLAESGPSIEKFLNQGLTELGAKLGPINWQFMESKEFDEADFGAFLELLPASLNGVALRHAVEVRHASFATPAFVKLAKAHGVAIVCAEDENFPRIDEATAPFTYARFMATHGELVQGVDAKTLGRIAKKCRGWAERGPVFAYFIAGAKERNPTAAMALIARLGEDG